MLQVYDGRRSRAMSRFSSTRRCCAVLACLSGLIVSASASSHDQAEQIGHVHFPISCGADVQRGLEYALAMLHSFWFPQCIDAFIDLTKAQPGCAMAFWGLAISQRSNPLTGEPSRENTKRGWEAIQQATRLEAQTPRERDYVSAMSAYYEDWDKRDYRSRILRYEAAMEDVYRRYPEDLEAAVLYALALNEAITVLPADKTYSRQLQAARILDGVLSKDPEHPGALHYLIHSYDFPGLAQRGLDAANKYAAIASSAPHARHMPSHTYSMLGMWDESIRSNQAALSIAKSYVHAMDFMVYAHLQMAQDEKAKGLVEASAALRKSAPAANQRTPTGSVLTVYTAHAAIPARYVIERGAWREAAVLEPHLSSPVGDAITHFTRAMGFARLGDGVRAREEIETLRGLRDELTQLQQDYWAQQVEIQRKAAAAWVALLDGDNSGARSLMRSAADAEDASEKHVAMENRLWPMRELLGELLLAINEPRSALQEFEASLALSPNRLRGLYGAAKAAQRTGDNSKAAGFYERVLSLARNADSNRQEISEAQAFLVPHREPGAR
jgi:tetratricopeptide (TPR) repeat protein